jgi:hypothetical protein
MYLISGDNVPVQDDSYVSICAQEGTLVESSWKAKQAN